MLRVPCYDRGQSKKRRRHGATALGEKTITRLSFRKLACVLAPVVLTGCGAPIGLQIASVFADGVSLLTTDKTLTDHGLSALTEKDCAVLRGLKGEEICRDDTFDATDVADLEITPPAGEPDMEDSAIPETPLAQAGPAPSLWNPPGNLTGNQPENKPGGVKTASFPELPAPLFAKVETTNLPEIKAPQPAETGETVEAPKAQSPVGSDLDAPVAAPVNTPVENPVNTPVETPVAAPVPAEHAEPIGPAEPAAEVKGGTFYVLASYRRLTNAKRFARTQAKWSPKILSGTASGRHVYRVAVGPADGARAFQLKVLLKRDGLKDAWALKLANPKMARERVSLD